MPQHVRLRGSDGATAADTVLWLTRSVPIFSLPLGWRDPVPMGFHRAHSGIHDGRFVIVASGSFPREEETWIFWRPAGTTAEPRPNYRRLLRITCPENVESPAGQDCRVQVLLQAGRPDRTTAPTYEAYEGRIHLWFSVTDDTVALDLPWFTHLSRPEHSGDWLRVFGRVVTNRADHRPNDFASALAEFDRHWEQSAPASQTAGSTGR